MLSEQSSSMYLLSEKIEVILVLVVNIKLHSTAHIQNLVKYTIREKYQHTLSEQNTNA
jgi:hypothetical protein